MKLVLLCWFMIPLFFFPLSAVQASEIAVMLALLCWFMTLSFSFSTARVEMKVCAPVLYVDSLWPHTQVA